jgi:hypothetical protein
LSVIEDEGSLTLPNFHLPLVYVSYSWASEKDTPIIDELSNACNACGLDVRIDKNQLEHGDFIQSFMDEIGSNSHIVLVFSRDYFESEYCMYELLQIWKNGGFQQRVHPFFTGEFFLDNVDFQLSIIKHWDNKAKNLQEKLSQYQYDMVGTVALQRLQIIYSEISHYISSLLDFLSNMLIVSMDELRQQQFNPLLKNIMIQSEIDEVTTEINMLKSSYVSEYKDISEWLSVNRNSLIDMIYSAIIEEFGDLIANKKNIATSSEMRRFKNDLLYFISQLGVCLLNKNTNLIDEPVFEVFIERRFYEFAFSLLIKRVPDHIADESVKKLKYYVDYLVERL